MIGITKKRLYKIKKIKNQSRKIPKRKHKRKRKKKQNKSFRRRRKYNLKNKSLKKYKGGGFFTFNEIMEDRENTEIKPEHRAKLARLKEASKRGKKVIIKQIIPVKDRQDLYDITDLFFEFNDATKKIELKNVKDTTKTPENIEERMLKNKLLGLQLRITRKNMDLYTKPLYEILNSILLKQALAEYKGGLQRFLKNPLYNIGPNSLPDIKKNNPFHDIGDENSGSQELMKLLMQNKWYKAAFTNPDENYSVASIETASAFPALGLETGTQVLSTKEEGVNPPPTMVVPPGVAVSSKRPTPPPPPLLQANPEDIPSKDDSDDETDSVVSEQTETDDETIEEGNVTSASEIAKLEALLSSEDSAFDEYNKKMTFNDFDNDDAYAFFEEDIQQSPSLLTKDQIKKEVEALSEQRMDDMFQGIQSTDDVEFVTNDADDLLQEFLGNMIMTSEEEEQLLNAIVEDIRAGGNLTDRIVDKLPKDSTEPLEEPVPGIEEALKKRERTSRDRADSLETKTSFDGAPAEEGLIRGPTPRPGTPLGKKIKGKIGSKLRDYADAANDPDTGMRARLGKLAPKKYVKLPPPDKPNIYFKATFRNDDWNLKLEKEGFAKDARSWLARVGIMSGGNIGEIESY